MYAIQMVVVHHLQIKFLSYLILATPAVRRWHAERSACRATRTVSKSGDVVQLIQHIKYSWICTKFESQSDNALQKPIGVERKKKREEVLEVGLLKVQVFSPIFRAEIGSSL